MADEEAAANGELAAAIQLSRFPELRRLLCLDLSSLRIEQQLLDILSTLVAIILLPVTTSKAVWRGPHDDLGASQRQCRQLSQGFGV